MGTGLVDHLADLDRSALVELLRRRPDVRREPVPRDLARVAQRLEGGHSLALAVQRLDRDTLEVGRAVAVLGDDAVPDALAALLDADPALVRRSVDVLSGLGLVWPDGAVLRLPAQLAAHWRDEVARGEPIARLARSMPVDELRRVATAQGLDVAGLRKAEVAQALHDAWHDPAVLRQRIAALPATTRALLAEICGRVTGAPHGPSDDRVLLDAGLILQDGRFGYVAREVVVAEWLAGARPRGVPDLPQAPDDAGRVASGALAAAHEWLRLTTTVLDEAATTPLAALKGGGVGKRERARLVKRLDLADDATACLVLDLAADAGLLGRTAAGYAPTEEYAAWRESDAPQRWARLAEAWFALEFCSGDRIVDGKEVAPPEPLLSTAGQVRRALLGAVGDRSVRACEAEVDWFCPWHDLAADEVAHLLALVHREAELLGVVVGDSLSPLGRAVVAERDGGDLAAAVAGDLVDPTCEVVLQSDLTALVSGRPDLAVTRLLEDAARPESRGSATVHRFSPASVRTAMDRGWDAEGLLAALRGLSERPVPQPLEYLVRDVARRHGEVRVRPVSSCLVLEETLAEELLRTRSLRSLGLVRLAPTVLSSPAAPAAVLEALRQAGHFPVREDESGALTVERDETRLASSAERPARDLVTPEDLADRVREAGIGHPEDTVTGARLAELAPHLDPVEIDLLADALDEERPVTIVYRGQSGAYTKRVVTPYELHHRRMVAWCHLRDDEREFTVARIQEVLPPE
ncbi:helicase-associated domain-containing protein [Actinomycetospora sp. TBRC 11914]|uniref:helicase-associated domain-containing protein n=1 Tax=Actinomycetospora sp. TBRC 11914 TaxID=2729387 RepID=UPI00145F5374|nr:helicase-associated domain-containing protein [Actinomycetospora sp. TBRC 11914]NMO90311.1 WYL domain-containing protein [Actinomycetospora sp. TBRC 11914]